MKLQPMKIGNLTFRMPIIQGGMGIGISSYKLAGSVSKAGGLGVLSAAQIGYREDDFHSNTLEANIQSLKKNIKKAKAICSNAPIGVNIMVAMNHYKELVEASIEAGADIIISGAGIPADLPGFARNTTTKFIPIVSSLKAARIVTALWEKNYQQKPDAIIVEGPLAGGHLGFKMKDILAHKEKDLSTITKDILAYFKENQKDIPIIPAGGIWNGKDIAHYLQLGASGVQMATRFVTTRECDAHENYKTAYIQAKKEDIQILESPVGLPGRAIYNDFMETLFKKGSIPPHSCDHCLAKCNPSTIPFCINASLIKAVEGDTANSLLFAGANAYKCKKIETVQGIMDEIHNEINMC